VAERDAIAKASGLARDQLKRLKDFLGNPSHTVQNRAEKLFAILGAINLHEFTIIGDKKITVDLKLVRQLIKGRNKLAHKGSEVDENLLYNVLFPISLRVLPYLNASDMPSGQASPNIPSQETARGRCHSCFSGFLSWIQRFTGRH
jgi:hypothetical protein